MSTGIVRVVEKITITRDGNLYGPFETDVATAVGNAATLIYTIADSTTLQLIGGVSPEITAITTVTFLQIKPDQDILIGLQGITIATQGAPLSADGVFTMAKCALTNVAIRNESGSTVNVTITIESA